jgi:hypothetical protein
MMQDPAALGVPAQPAAAGAEVAERERFVVRTYSHLLGAVVGFVLLELAYFSSGLAETIATALLSVSWLLVLGAFILVGWIARGVAASAGSTASQYAALGGYVLAESIIFVPLLYLAEIYAPGAIRSAATLTILGFVALTAVVFQGGRDFSFLGGSLRWIGVVALAAIAGAVLFGFELGTWFSVAMVGLAAAAILYETSRIARTYPTDRHVAASLELFASVALMFWYLIRLVSFRD